MSLFPDPGSNLASLPRAETPHTRQRRQPPEETRSARAPRNAQARSDRLRGSRCRGRGSRRREASKEGSQEAGDGPVVGCSPTPTGGRRRKRPRRPRCPPLPWGGSRSRCSRLRRPPASGARPHAGARARNLRHPPAPAPAAAPPPPPPPPTFCRRHHSHFLLFPLLSSPSVDYQVSARLLNVPPRPPPCTPRLPPLVPRCRDGFPEVSI